MFKINKKIISLVVLMSIFGSLAVPRPSEARNLFQKFFRDLRHGVQFVVKLPNRATRWMGPVLGPIAAAILTQNLSGSHKFGQLFTKVRRINDVAESIETQKRLTGEVRQMYRDQATELRSQLEKLQASREELRRQLLDADVSWDDYKVTAIEMDELIKTVETTANNFDQTADNLRTEDIIKMAGNQLFGQVVGELQNAVVYEVRDEINSFINPTLIGILTNQQSGGLESVLDMLISGELSTGNYDGKFDADELKNRVKNRIEELMKNNKDALQENMQEQINQIIQEMSDKMNEEAGNLVDKVDETTSQKESEESGDTVQVTTPPADANGCKPGYHWNARSGVGCQQTNCSNIANAHYSYTGRCICGSAGSMNEKATDPNKSCSYGSDYKACPGCVYACVGVGEECGD